MIGLHKRISAAILIGLLALSLAACASKAPESGQTPNAGTVAGTVTASGSTALLPLVQAAKEQFEDKYSKVTVNVSGGGSFNGLSQVESGAVQIGNSDVEPASGQGKDLVDFKVAVAPFVIIINKDVTVTNVTMDQLAKILKGEITNWKDVGGKDAKITIVSRQQSSGSRATMVAKVLKSQGDIAKDAVVQDSNGKVLDGVTSTPGAVGYVDAPYLKPDKVNTLKIDGVEYSAQAVTSGKWLIFAYEHMYTKGQPTGAVKALLDFILSTDFQEKTVEKLGFIPVSKMTK